MTVLQIIEEIAATPGKNDKRDIIARHADNPLLREVFRLTYEGLITYGVKKIPEYEVHFEAYYTLGDALKILQDEFATRRVTGHAAEDRLRDVLSHMRNDDADVFRRVILRDLKCGASGKSANTAWPDLIAEFGVSLAGKFNPKKMKWPAMVQLKSDGARAVSIIRGGIFQGSFTRSGREIAISETLVRQMETLVKGYDGVVFLDGELLAVDEDGKVLPRHIGNGIINKALKGSINKQESESLTLNLWDMYGKGFEETPYKYRYEFLRQAFADTQVLASTRIEIADNNWADTPEEALSIGEWHISNGHEGAIVKNPDFIWQGKRTNDQQKIKEVLSCELRIVDVIEGTGKYVGKMGALTVASDDGRVRCNVGTGFNDEDREYFWYNREAVMSTIVEVKYNDSIKPRKVDDTWSLFLPVFDRERHDRTSTDTFEKITGAK